LINSIIVQPLELQKSLLSVFLPLATNTAASLIDNICGLNVIRWWQCWCGCDG